MSDVSLDKVDVKHTFKNLRSAKLHMTLPSKPYGKCSRIHLLWSQEHDWGRDAKLIQGHVVVQDNDYGLWRAFESFKDLEIWAGY